MSNEVVDVLVIGAGIMGAGVAQAAAAAGYSVRVLEQTGIASGTSSRSSKLIHGGLRYLESAQFALVRECLTERALLLKLAPHLVQLKPFHIPVYKHTTRRPWQIRSGLTLYALLGGLTKDTRFQRVPRAQWATLDGLTTDGLQQVFRYYDAQTDDTALTQAVTRSAQSLGAELIVPARFTAAEIGDDGVTVHYDHNNAAHQCRARLIINAGGPWANRILQHVTPAVPALEMDLVQGTHIIIDSRLHHGLYYLEAPRDQRAVFALPWQGRLMVGTTETFYSGEPQDVHPLEEEQDYLLTVLAHYFPAYRHLSRNDISASFAGLRVLPKTTGAAFSRPRETVFHPDNPHHPRLFTLYGGKLTAYRATAAKLMQHIKYVLPQRTPLADTRMLPLQ